ncbi:MAG TPA: DUF1073 domain-containing protein [Verrucomicrobiales bacterium]|nr:DUF1073 domain-containing protein [Verrucomicrobiales bacterium]
MMQNLMNSVRRVENLFPGWFQDAKHDHYADYGWPKDLTFQQLYSAYHRNGLARSAVDKTILKTWESSPEIWESEKPAESDAESDIRQRFDDLNLWRALAEADRRSIVGGYAGAILRYGDNQPFSAPVQRVPGGLDGLVEVVPVWAGQMTVSLWNTDQASMDYGKPAMFTFNEAAIRSQYDTSGQPRMFDVHPDRVLIWSADGTIHARSALEPGYNDLIDAEKIKGAGGEGFWKNAKAAPVLEMDKEARLADMARSMGVSEAEIADAMNDQVGDWQRGFDRLLMLQGMTAKTLSITLPSPEHFFAAPIQSFAASMMIPQKILIGNQTGERASTEDQDDWARVNMARRSSVCLPLIRDMLRRFEAAGIIPERDWHIEWDDLTDSGPAEKMDRAVKMSGINAQSISDPLGGGRGVFTADEIRAAVDMEPLDAIEEIEE